MMDFLARLRPKAATSSSIAESITALDAEAARLDGEIAALAAQRGDALLAGGKEAEQLEADLRARRDDRERVAAMQPALRRRLDEAAQREVGDRVRALIREAVAARDAYAKFLAGYPELARKIAEGLTLEAKAREAIARAGSAYHDASGNAPQDVALPTMPEIGVEHTTFGLGAQTVLPNPANGYFWPLPPQSVPWHREDTAQPGVLAAMGMQV